MSVILVNTPKTKSLGTGFQRISLKSQHSLAGVILQNKHDRPPDLKEEGLESSYMSRVVSG